MHRFAVLSPRLLLVLLLPVALLKGTAQGVPATAPTQSVSDLPSARPAMPPYQAHGVGGTKAVRWDGTELTIHASGEDLPTILTNVAHATGLKVTGGVPDERVFGEYGPGPVQKVIADLFGGMYVNLLLLNGTATQPKELILTPRTGGATPPSPARSIAYDPAQNRVDRPFRGTAPTGVGLAPQQPVLPPSDGGAPGANNGTSGTNSGIPGANSGVSGVNSSAAGPDPNANPTSDANGQPESPNGVRTPEQIFEELRKRQSAQQGGAPTQ